MVLKIDRSVTVSVQSSQLNRKVIELELDRLNWRLDRWTRQTDRFPPNRPVQPFFFSHSPSPRLEHRPTGSTPPVLRTHFLRRTMENPPLRTGKPPHPAPSVGKLPTPSQKGWKSPSPTPACKAPSLSTTLHPQ